MGMETNAGNESQATPQSPPLSRASDLRDAQAWFFPKGVVHSVKSYGNCIDDGFNSSGNRKSSVGNLSSKGGIRKQKEVRGESGSKSSAGNSRSKGGFRKTRGFTVIGREGGGFAVDSKVIGGEKAVLRMVLGRGVVSGVAGLGWGGFRGVRGGCGGTGGCSWES
uniref:Uncharacterized protein n=1 Tax=Chenopodium quinoa TaxID=63459 RepID=A0A803MDE0_CHEQI